MFTNLSCPGVTICNKLVTQATECTDSVDVDITTAAVNRFN